MPTSRDPSEFIRILAPAMVQAAAITAALEGRVPNVGKPGADSAAKSALTIADTAAQEALLVPLALRFGHARLEAEEDTRSVERFAGTADDVRIVIDPLDGTLHFYLAAEGPYAIMAGLAIRSRYEAALVSLPREGWYFEAVLGAGARRGRLGANEAATPSREGNTIFVTGDVPAATIARLAASGFRVQRACGGAASVAPLLPGVRGALRVRSSGSISTRGRIGILVTAEAGGLVQTRDGKPFPAGIDTPADTLVVAADAAVARELRSALAA